MKNVTVTFKTNKTQTKLIESILKEHCKLSFLNDGSFDSLKEAEVMFAWNPPRELKGIDKNLLKNLEFVQLLSAGFDHLDLSIFPANCKIASNKGAYAEPMSEHILAMILAISKKLMVNQKKLSRGIFDQKTINVSLKHSTCTILGFGGIGKATAKLLRPFGTKIFAINTSGKSEEKLNFIGTLKDIDYVLKNSDIIVVSLPLNDETSGLIDKKRLQQMKPNAIIINTARGDIIKQKDLYEHLINNPDFNAGIDAWWIEPFSNGEFKIEYPFFDLPNFLGSPHNSALVPDSLLNGVRIAAENILNYLEGKEVINLIN
jgi:lactate dehydrogenase-like 2-hydroxyacid dehydrogenase